VLSVAPRGTIRFSVHLPLGRTQYTVEILRFGEQDAGGNAVGQTVAGPFTCTNGRRRDFDEVNAYVNGARWPVSFSLEVLSSGARGVAPCTGASLPASTWKSGIYTAKITDSISGDYFHMTFIVKGSAQTRKGDILSRPFAGTGGNRSSFSHMGSLLLFARITLDP
jgi:hypothetical protein